MFLEKIFSIKNSDDNTKKIITILGIKIKITNKNRFDFPSDAKEFVECFKDCKNTVFKNKRAAVFATFNKEGKINEDVIKYLKAARPHLDFVVVVSDNPVIVSEVEKIKPFVDYVIFKRHNEYDFGSYKRGYLKLKELGILENIENLLFFNDSVIFEGENLDDVFLKSENKDFYGILTCRLDLMWKKKCYSTKHLQSWFVVFSKEIFNSAWFFKFIKSIKFLKQKKDIIVKYEMGLSKLIQEKGYELNSYYPFDPNWNKNPDLIYANPEAEFENRIFIKKRFLK